MLFLQLLAETNILGTRKLTFYYNYVLHEMVLPMYCNMKFHHYLYPLCGKKYKI